MSQNEINKLVDNLSKNYLGKFGITGITLQKKNNKSSIIFYANLNKLQYNEVPSTYKGLKIYIKPSKTFVTLQST